MTFNELRDKLYNGIKEFSHPDIVIDNVKFYINKTNYYVKSTNYRPSRPRCNFEDVQ